MTTFSDGCYEANGTAVDIGHDICSGVRVALVLCDFVQSLTRARRETLILIQSSSVDVAKPMQVLCRRMLGRPKGVQAQPVNNELMTNGSQGFLESLGCSFMFASIMPTTAILGTTYETWGLEKPEPASAIVVSNCIHRMCTGMLLFSACY